MSQGESKLSRDIMTEIRARDGFCFKVHGNEFTMTGVPDIVGVYRGVSIWFETKMPGKTLSPIQRLRQRLIRQAGGVAVRVQSLQEASAYLDRIDALKPTYERSALI